MYTLYLMGVLMWIIIKLTIIQWYFSESINYSVIMSRRITRRHQPYDLENPGNWTVNKLKMEIEKIGMKLTSNVPKSTLLQIYNQLPSGISQNNHSEPNTVNPNSEMETPVVSEMDTIDQIQLTIQLIKTQTWTLWN